MKRISIYTFFLLLVLISCTKIRQSAAEKYFVFFNNNQKDSLQQLLTDDFQLQRTFTSYSNDRNSFFDTYLPNVKAVHGKYNILQVISEVEPKQFLVEDESNYFTYLNIKNPSWKITIATIGNKVNRVTIDTTEKYHQHAMEMRVKHDAFTAWLKSNYPEETEQNLMKSEGLLTERLKDYAKRK